MKTVEGQEDGNKLFYSIYQALPVGAVFLDPHLNVFSANRKMRLLFPPRQNGLSLANLIRCPSVRSAAPFCAQSPECRSCVLWKGVCGIVRDGVPMPETEWNYIGFQKRHRQVRWFRVNGTPASYAGKRYAVLFFSDMTEQVRQERILREKLKLDQPTGVLNKISLIRSLDVLLRTGQREAFTLCMIDFDDFKSLNDRFGHLAGDRVLNTFCRIARRNIRAGDSLGRYGGEEFLFLFKAGVEQSEKILERIRGELRASFAGTFSIPVTFSAGVVRCGGSACDWKELIRTADGLLYRAKAKGKNQNCYG